MSHDISPLADTVVTSGVVVVGFGVVVVGLGAFNFVQVFIYRFANVADFCQNCVRFFFKTTNVIFTRFKYFTL